MVISVTVTVNLNHTTVSEPRFMPLRTESWRRNCNRIDDTCIYLTLNAVVLTCTWLVQLAQHWQHIFHSAVYLIVLTRTHFRESALFSVCMRSYLNNATIVDWSFVFC